LEELHHAGSKRAAGATETDAKSLLFQYAWWLKKQGYAESTIVSRVKLLRILAKRGANLLDPESVKKVIAEQKWSEGRKANAVDAYSSLLEMLGKTWTPPRYKRPQKLPWIPLEKEIDQLISGCGFKTGTFLQLLKETGLRSGEAIRLKWRDLDTANRLLIVNDPEKGGSPRIFKLSRSLVERLNALPKVSERIFGNVSLKTLRRMFEEQRKRLAKKTRNPRLLRITFHTIRHWYATTLYHKTKDILFVKKMLGHRSLKNTLIYIDLERAIYGDPESDEYVVKVASTLEEACRLIEKGFEYVTEMEGYKIFRKRL